MVVEAYKDWDKVRTLVDAYLRIFMPEGTVKMLDHIYIVYLDGCKALCLL